MKFQSNLFVYNKRLRGDRLMTHVPFLSFILALSLFSLLHSLLKVSAGGNCEVTTVTARSESSLSFDTLSATER